MSERTINSGAGTVTSAAPPTDAGGSRHVLTLAAGSTVLVLLAFVTPLATGVRTAAALHAGPAGLTWMLSAMSVGLAVALLTAGVLADDRGRRRVFVAGLVLLGAASAVAGAAGRPGVVIAARLVEGLGGAAVLAGGLGMIGHAYPTGPARARAAAIWGAAVGAGTGLGGIVAVVLDGGEGSWRVTYAATAVAALVLAVVARRLLPESATTAPRPVDVAGVVLLAAGMGALLAGLVESRSGTPWTSAALLVAGAALLGAFVAVQARRRAPLIDLALFRSRGFVAATVGALVAGIGVVGVVSYVPTVLQRGLGAALPAVMVLMLVWSVVGTATSWLLRRAHAINGRVLLVVSLGISAAGLVGLAVLAPGASLWRLLPGIVVLGVGYGGANAALGREAIAHVPPARAGMGSGTSNTARYLGSALGVTLAALLATPTAAPAALLSGFDATVLGAAALSAAGAVLVAAARRSRSAAVDHRGMSITSQPPWCSVTVNGRPVVAPRACRSSRSNVRTWPQAGVGSSSNGTATTARRRATRSISASTVASRPRGRCSSRCTAKTVSADASRRGTASALPARVVTGVPSAAETLPSRCAVPGTRSTAVTSWPSAASRSDRKPKQQPSSTTCGPTASAAARSCTGAMPAFVPPGSPPLASARSVLR